MAKKKSANGVKSERVQRKVNLKCFQWLYDKLYYSSKYQDSDLKRAFQSYVEKG